MKTQALIRRNHRGLGKHHAQRSYANGSVPGKISVKLLAIVESCYRNFRWYEGPTMASGCVHLARGRLPLKSMEHHTIEGIKSPDKINGKTNDEEAGEVPRQ